MWAVAADGGRRATDEAAARSGFTLPGAQARTPSGPWSDSRAAALLLFGLALFALALAPRWVARDTYVTADEDNWMRRAGGFAWGLANGRPGRTYQNGHPGVLTMELAILGQGPGGAERFADPVTGGPRVVAGVPGFFGGLVEARRAFALASAVGVALFGLLAWRLLGPGPGVIGGLLLAFDPFFLAHSPLVHLDAALTVCMGLAYLCGLVRWSGGDRRWVVVGGVLSGLALLAKVPAVFLALAVPLSALALGRRRGWRTLVLDLGLWAVAALAALVLFWPSMWVNPVSSIERMADFARETGGQPHEQGSFFLGRPVVDPGPLFYLLAVPLRLGPPAMLGLAALALIAWRNRDGVGRHRPLILALVGYAIGFGIFMSIGAKKFDRYLLPAFPVLDLLAGFGLCLAWKSLSQWVGAYSLSLWERAGVRAGRSHRQVGDDQVSPSPPPSPFGRGSSLGRGSALAFRALSLLINRSLALSLFAVLVIVPLVAVYPHYLAYYNPLLGGGATAVRLIPVGEGEGLKEAAAWLNAQPDAENLSVVAHGFDVLKATYVGGGEALRDRVPPSADFVLLYLYQTQIGHSAQVLSDYAERQPEHVVRLHGIDYVRIYRGPHRAAVGPARAGSVARGR